MQMVQDGCGQLLREAGLRLMQLVMEEEAARLVGPRHQQDDQRRGYRWGNEAGYWWWMDRRYRSSGSVYAAKMVVSYRWGVTNYFSAARR